MGHTLKYRYRTVPETAWMLSSRSAAPRQAPHSYLKLILRVVRNANLNNRKRAVLCVCRGGMRRDVTERGPGPSSSWLFWFGDLTCASPGGFAVACSAAAFATRAAMSLCSGWTTSLRQRGVMPRGWAARAPRPRLLLLPSQDPCSVRFAGSRRRRGRSCFSRFSAAAHMRGRRRLGGAYGRLRFLPTRASRGGGGATGEFPRLFRHLEEFSHAVYFVFSRVACALEGNGSMSLTVNVFSGVFPRYALEGGLEAREARGA